MLGAPASSVLGAPASSRLVALSPRSCWERRLLAGSWASAHVETLRVVRGTSSPRAGGTPALPARARTLVRAMLRPRAGGTPALPARSRSYALCFVPGPAGRRRSQHERGHTRYASSTGRRDAGAPSTIEGQAHEPAGRRRRRRDPRPDRGHALTDGRGVRYTLPNLRSIARR